MKKSILVSPIDFLLIYRKWGIHVLGVKEHSFPDALSFHVSSMKGKIFHSALLLLLFNTMFSFTCYSQTAMPTGAGKFEESSIDEILKNYNQSLYFQENAGQWGNPEVLFKSRNRQSVFQFLRNGVSIGVFEKKQALEQPQLAALKNSKNKKREPLNDKSKKEERKGFVWNMLFVGANPMTKVTGRVEHIGNINYITNEWGKVISDTKAYEEVWYKDAYPSIDARFYSSEKHNLEYDFIIYPNGNPDNIQLEMDGVTELEINPRGQLVFETPLGELKKGKPYAYQVIEGREVEILSRYRLLENNKISFEILSEYNEDEPLIIDPIVLEYATFLGLGDSGYDVISMDVDKDGNVVVLANSDDIDLPVTPGVVGVSPGLEAVIAKFDPTLSNLLFITHVPGPADEVNYPYMAAISTDSNNDIFFLGQLNFTTGHISAGANMPTTPGAYQESHNLTGSTVIGFLGKISSDGTALQAMTYLSPGGGASGADVRPEDLEINSADEVIVAGGTESPNFPETTAASPQQTYNDGGQDIFIIKLDNSLTTLLGSSYLGGSDWEYSEIFNLEIGPSDQLYITSNTYSDDFPVTVDAYVSDFSTMQEAGTIAIFNSDITNLIYSSYFMRSNPDGQYFVELKDIAVNSDGSYVVTGEGNVGGMPFTLGTYAAIPPDDEYTGIVAKFDASHNLIFSSNISNNPDFSLWAFGLDAAMDEVGNVYVLGRMNAYASTQESGIIPTGDALFSEVEDLSGSDWSNYLVKIAPDGSKLLYATLLYFEDDISIYNADRLLVEDCKIYIAESTRGSGLGLPGTPNAYDPTQAQWDASIMIFDAGSTSDSSNTLSPTFQDVCINGRTAAITGSDLAYVSNEYIQDGVVKQTVIVPTYQWQSSNDGVTWEDVPGAVQKDFLPAPTSTDTYFRRIAGNCECDRDTSNVHLVDVGTDEAPSMSDGTVLACQGIGIQIGGPATGGTNTTYTYDWFPSTGLDFDNIAQPTATLTLGATYNVVVTDDTNNCQFEEQWQVSMATVDAGEDVSYCGGDELALIGTSGQPGLTYSWVVLPGGDDITSLSNPNIPQPLASPSFTTSYELTLTIPDAGCSIKDTAVVTPFSVTADAGLDTTLCMGEDLVLGGEASASGYTYGWAPGVYISSQTIAQPEFQSVLCPEQDIYPETNNPLEYTLTKIHTATGCKDVDTIAVTLLHTELDDLCGSPVTLGIQDDSCGVDLPGVMFLWSVITGDATSIIGQESERYPVVLPDPDTPATIYQLDVSLNNKTCSAQMMVTPCFCDVEIDKISDISCPVGGQYNTQLDGKLDMPGMSNGNLPDGFHYEWFPTFGLANPSSLLTVVNAIPQDTTYYLSIIDDSNGSALCIDSIRVYASLAADPFAGLNIPEYVCASEPTTIGVSGVAGWDYLWSPSTGLDNAYISNPIATVASPITYSVTATDAVTGCEINVPIEVAVKYPIINAGEDGAFCDNAIVQLGTLAVPGQTYSWEPAVGLSEPNIAQPLDTLFISAQFILTVTDTASGCTAVDTINYTLTTPPTVDAGADVTICAGGGTIIGPEGMLGWTYQWTPTDGLSDPTIAQPFANPSSETTYTLLVNDGNAGCYASDDVTVFVGPAYTLDAPDVTTCETDSVQIGVVDAGGTYSWSPVTGLGQPNSSFTNALPPVSNTYVLTWTTPDGCQVADEATVTIQSTPAISVSDATTCEGSGTVIGPTSETDVIYSWDVVSGDPLSSLNLTNIAQPTANPSQTTVYEVTASRASGCLVKDTVTVNAEALPVVDLGADFALCGNDTLKAEIVGVPIPGTDHSTSFEDVGLDSWMQDVTDNFDWTWQTGGTSSSSTGPSSASVGDYYLYTEGNLNYNDTARLVSPSITLGATTESLTFDYHMYGSNMGTMNFDISTDGGGIWTNLWTQSGNKGDTWFAASIDLSAYTGQTVQFRFEGIVGTSFRSDMAIDNVLLPGATYSYSWNTQDVGACLPIMPTEETIYSVTVTSPNGCSDVDSITVTPPYEVELGFDREICPNESISIGIVDLGGGYTYSWLPTDGLSDPSSSMPSASPTSTTTYVLSVDNGAGCIIQDSFTISLKTPPNLSLIGPQTICNGSCATLSVTAEAGVTYHWSPSTGLSTTTGSSIAACPTDTTIYTVTAVGLNGCTATTTATVFVDTNPPPVANAGNDQTVCSSETVQLGTAQTGDYTYYWSSPDAGGVTALSNAYIAAPTVTLNNTSSAPLVRTFFVEKLDNTTLCSDLDTVVVTVSRYPVITVKTIPELCLGGGTLPLSSTYISYSGSNRKYTWSPAANVSDVSAQYPILSVTETTNFTIIVEDTLTGCATSASLVLNVSTETITADAGPDQTVCVNDSVTVGTVPASTPLGNDHSNNWDVSSIGGWTQATNDNFNWTRKYRYSTTTSNTGPSGPISNWYYMYTESGGRAVGDSARIVSPSIAISAATYDMSFYYHMYGAQMGTLKLDVSTDGGTTWTTLWSLLGDQGDAWTQQLVDISAYAGMTVNFSFVGVVGGSLTSDMAIDDVNIPGSGPAYAWYYKSTTGTSFTVSTTYYTNGTTRFDAQPQVLTNGTFRSGTYRVEITSENGCVATDEVIITVLNEADTIDAGTNQYICGGTEALMNAISPSQGTTVWTQQSGPTTATLADSTLATTQVSGLATGIYVFKWEVTDVCNPGADYVTIEVVDSPVLVTSPVVGCNLVSLLDPAVTAGSSNLGELTYWVDTATTIQLLRPDSIVNSAIYYIKTTTIEGCQSIQPVTVNTNDCPCGLTITTTYSDNCAGDDDLGYTANWNIGLTSNGNIPDNEISYQRNSEAIQIHTLTGNMDNLTIAGIPADGGGYDTLMVWFTNDPICGDTIILKRPVPCPADVTACNGTDAGCIGGNAFEDFNCDGTDGGTSEPGVQGVQVIVYDCNNNPVDTAWTDAEGDWEICGLTDNDAYRVEFILPESIACWAQPTHVGGDNGSDIQFVTAPDCANFSLSSPMDYCEENPPIVVACYESGNSVYGATGNEGKGIISMPYNSSGATPTGITEVAKIYEVGTVWGMAWQPSQQRMFASSFLKRHSGFGPEGIGGVYVMDFASGTGHVANSFDLQGVAPVNGGSAIDLGSVTRTGGADFNLPDNNTGFNRDLDAFDKTGKIGFGDADMADDRNTLWLVNLNQRALISVDVSDTTTYPGAVNQYPIDNFSNLPNCTNGTLRPWALAFEKGRGYLGCVCTAEDGGAASEMKAYVLSFDPNNPTSFVQEFSMDLDYTREKIADYPVFGVDIDGEWHPWVETWDETWYTNSSFDLEVGYAQPILSDIDFSSDGSMALGFADRFGFQIGFNQFKPVSGNTSVIRVDAGGDLIKVAKVNGSWVLEANENDDATKSTLGTDGPLGTGEFFYSDAFEDTDESPKYNHNETFVGGLGILKGTNEVIGTHYDPVDGGSYAFDLGFIWHNTTNGSRSDDFRIVESGSASSKGNGLGDPMIACAPAPLEIGNYVWCDSLENGIQDACEQGIDSIIVQLYDAVGTLVGQDTTINGQYYFNQYNVDTTGVTVTAGAASPNATWSGLDYSTQYFIVFGDGQFNTDQFLIDGTSFGITPVVDAGSNDNIDSDVNGGSLTAGSLGDRPDGLPYISMNTGETGCGDHKYDMGVTCVCPEITELVSDRNICSGENVDTLAALTSFGNPDSIAFVYFTSAQTDSTEIYNNGTGIDTVQITSGNDTVRTTDVSVAAFTNTGTAPDTFYVYAIAHPAHDLNSCRPYEEILVIVHPNPTADIVATNESCPENNDGGAVAGATGGTGPYTYQWGHGPITQGVSNLSAGLYEVTVTDSKGCTDSASVTITEPDTLKITLVKNDATCGDANGTASVSATGGTPTVNFLWEDGENTSGITGKAAGTYSVTATDANGCMVIDSITINNGGSPNTGTVTYTGCKGDGYFVMVEGARYDEFNPSGVETATNSAGCDSVITISLTYNDSPVLSSIDSTICEGASVDLVGLFSTTSGTLTYHSATPPTVGNELVSTVVSPTAVTTYYTVATNGDNCMDTLGVTITPNSPDANMSFINDASGIAGDTVVCHGEVLVFGGAVTFGSGTPPYTYEWTADPSANFTFDNPDNVLFTQGTYTNTTDSPIDVTMKLVVTDSLGCTDSVAFDAQVQPQLAIDSIQIFDESGSEGDQGVCFGDSISFKVHNSPAGSYTYLWSTGATTDSINVKPPYDNNNTLYNVTVTDAFGCTDASVVSAKGFPEITATVDFIQSCSTSDPDTLLFNVSGGVPRINGYLIDVSTEALPINSFTPLKVPINESAGTMITTIVDDEKGCGPTLTITVPAVDYLDVTLSSTPETCSDATGTALATPSGGAGGYTYEWSTGAMTPSISGLSTGSYDVTIMDAAGCTVSKSISVSDDGSSMFGSVNYDGCNGDGFEVTVNSNVYNEATPTGMETFLGGASNGCDSIVTIALVFKDLPEISTRDTCVCLGASLDLSLLVQEDNAEAGTITYHSSKNGSETNADVIGNNVTPTDTTMYYIRKETAGGCFDTDSILVNLCDFDLALKKTVLTSGPYTEGGDVTYTIKVYNQGECEATEVIVHDYIPTGLTLNDANWDNSMNASVAVDTVAAIAAGDSATLTITLKIDMGVTGSLINNAEIVSAIGGNDTDSPLSDTNDGSTNELASDDNINDEAPNTPGTVDDPLDEDDYDPAEINVGCPTGDCPSIIIEKIGKAP